MLFFFEQDPNGNNAATNGYTDYADFVAENTVSFSFPTLPTAQQTTLQSMLTTALSPGGSQTIQLTLFTETDFANSNSAPGPASGSGADDNQIFDYSGYGFNGGNTFNFTLSQLQSCLDDLHAAAGPGGATTSTGTALPTDIYKFYGLNSTTDSGKTMTEAKGNSSLNWYYYREVIPETSSLYLAFLGLMSFLMIRKRQ